MRFDKFSFASIQIDGTVYEHDVIIDRGEIRKRKKKSSKKFREQFGRTPLSIDEEIPWLCYQLVIGSGGYERNCGTRIISSKLPPWIVLYTLAAESAFSR